MMRYLCMLLLVVVTVGMPSTAWAAEATVPLGVPRLDAESDTAYWERLFIQCASWSAPYAEVSEPAKAELVTIGLPAIAHLVPTYLGNGDVRHRVTLEEIITKIGPDTAPILIPYVGDPNPVLRQRVIYVLGGMEHPDILPALMPPILREPDLTVLPTLIEAIGKRSAGVSGVAPHLTPHLHRPEERIQRATVVALGRNGQLDSIDALVPLLNHGLFSVREPAQEACWAIVLANQGAPELLTKDASTFHAGGQALLLELQIATGWIVAGTMPSMRSDLLREFQAELDHAEKIEDWSAFRGLAQGALRLWRHDAAAGQTYLDALPATVADPRGAAVLREVRAVATSG